MICKEQSFFASAMARVPPAHQGLYFMSIKALIIELIHFTTITYKEGILSF
jgi:hypothetical protein